MLRVVAGSRVDGELAAPRCARLHLDRVIAGGGGSRGVIGEDVLIAYIAGDFGGDRIDILERGGEEGDAPGLAGEGFEGVAGAALVAAACRLRNRARELH